MTKRLAGKVAIVTGAGRGIGQEIAIQLANEGAQVVVNDLDAGAVEETRDVIARTGGVTTSFPGNVNDADFADNIIEHAVGHFGNVHIVINNAGYIWNEKVERTSDEQWDAMQDVHLKSAFRMCRSFGTFLRSSENSGSALIQRRLINISSVAATRGAVGQLAYSCAKSGLFGLTRSLAKEWGPLGVNVNCVSFGFIETRLTQLTDRKTYVTVDGEERPVGLPSHHRDEFVKNIPLGRPGTAKEGAGAVVLLCFPEASYISGQLIEAAGALIY